MAELYPNSIKYILNFIKCLVPDALIQQVQNFTFRINIHEYRTDVRFDQSEMEDFEIALEQLPNTNYFYTLENRTKFRILIALGEKGLIPRHQISSDLLQEKGEWLKNKRTSVSFDAEFCAILYEGLNLLSVFLGEVLSSGQKLPEMEEEKRIVDNLKECYEKESHLSSEGAEIESLSYLKAAAMCVIMEKEKAKRAAKIPRVIKAIDRELYSIVSKIRRDPFRDIKLPEVIRDYAFHQGTANTTNTLSYVREVVSDEEKRKLDGLLDRLDPRLRRRREGAWEALHSENADRLSQAANSMVELLDQVIGQVCKNTDLATFLTNKYQTHQETEWVDATRQWIGKTKSNLHSAKHHVDRQSEQLTKQLLTTSEIILLVILE